MIKFIFLIWMMVTGVFAAPIQNDEQFKTAVSSMGSGNKLVLMIYTIDDCPECACR